MPPDVFKAIMHKIRFPLGLSSPDPLGELTARGRGREEEGEGKGREGKGGSRPPNILA